MTMIVRTQHRWLRLSLAADDGVCGTRARSERLDDGENDLLSRIYYVVFFYLFVTKFTL